MQGKFKSKEQLVNELDELRQRITELEKSKTDLRQAEEKYRNIFNHCMEGIYQTTLEGRFIVANPSAARLLGYESPEDLINSVTDIGTQVYAYPEDRGKAIGLLREHGAFENFEMKCRKKDGSIVWGSLTSRLVRDNQGNILYIEGTSQDITQRKQMEEVLQESEEKYRSLVEHAYDAIMIADFEGNLLEVNKKTEELLGYTKEELLDINISQIHPGEELGKVERAFREMVEGKPSSLLDTKVLRKDGETAPIDISGGVITYGGRQVVQGIFRDITERKLMEEALKQTEHRFRSLSEASLEAIVFIEDGVIVDANEALNRLFGYEDEDLRGKIATDFIVPERRPFTDERMRARTVGIYETMGLRKDGSTFPIEVNPREFEQDGKKLRVSAVRDLTEREKIEKQLKDYQEHLERLVEERTNELKESEKKFRNIFENAQEGIFQSTPDGRLISANPALASMFGSEPPEELIQLITDIPEQLYADPAKRLELVDILTQAGAVQNFEFQVRRRDSVIKYASMNARAVKDERGEILFYEGTIQDITGKKHAEKALETERQSLEEANIALKVLLKHREEDRKDLEERFLSNVQRLVMPYVEKLKKSNLDPVQHMSLDFIESNLSELVSPFLKSIQGFKFTSRQLEVATLIREGRSTKDIAYILNMNGRAVEIQRLMIRKKLGLTRDKTNLQAFLKSLS